MSFGLNPDEWLQMLIDAHGEYNLEPLSIRKAVVCCVFANHLPEHLFSRYGASDPAKLRGATSLDSYRGHIAAAEPALAVIRDLCDYAKHGPALARKSVTVAKTEQSSALAMDSLSFFMGIYNHRQVEKLIVTHKDGSIAWVEGYLFKATRFWQGEFKAASL